ncbi:MAG: hypothetical protein NTW33_02720 [Methanoregula sp.]|nr:hypothetical protein [Methanoregula sp.]
MITRFPTLRLEGGLISSDQIDRVADQKSSRTISPGYRTMILQQLSPAETG